MLRRMILLFVVLPFVELVLLLLLADWTSWRIALLFIVLTGVTGAVVVRYQGVRAWRRIREDLAAGRMPADAVWDAAMIFVGGALMLTPGVLTDVFALSLLVPFCRRFYRAWLSRRFRSRTAVVYQSLQTGSSSGGHSEVIDSYVVKRHGNAS